MKKIMLLLPLALVLLIGLVSAATLTMKYPITSTSLPAGVVTLNATWDPADDSEGLSNLTNITYYAYASNTNQTSAVIVCVNNSMLMYNGTGGLNQTRCKFNTAVLQDSSVWKFYAIGTNFSDATQTFTSAEVTSVVVDNTVPATPTITNVARSIVEKDGVITYNWSDATTTTSTQTLYLGSNTYTMTCSGSTCTYTITGDMPSGTYNVYTSATDGLNVTDSAITQLQIESQSDWRETVGPTAEQIAVSTIEQQPGVLGGLFQNKLLLLLIFLVIVWWYGTTKK